MALISLDHVTKIYPKGTRPALDDVSLDIDRGDFVFLVGASGSGKSTLLSMLLREEEATDGEIRVAGNDLRRLTNRQVPQYRRQIGFVFQDYKLLNNKTVWQNVAFALEVIGMRRSTIKALVPKVLQTVGLTGKENNYPRELSGGEAQRVAIARAYVNHPQILLADEPTGNLDPTTSLGIMEVLEAINRTGTTIVMATHNEEIVNSMRKRVIELHTGKIVRDEAQGSYDSALYFPDAQVEANALEANGQSRDARFRPGGEATGIDGQTETAQSRIPGRKRDASTIEATLAVSQMSGEGNEGIARLASSVHSGRTGRYGEAFAPVETTLTWGKGLDLESLAKEEAAEATKSVESAESAESVEAAEVVESVESVETVETGAQTASDTPLEPMDDGDASKTDMPNFGDSQTGEADAGETAAVAEPTPLETTQPFDPLSDGWEPLDPAAPVEEPAAPAEEPTAPAQSVPSMPPAPPAPPVQPTPEPVNDEAADQEEER